MPRRGSRLPQTVSRGEWKDRLLGEIVLSMLTFVCHCKKVMHRVWTYLQARLAFTMASLMCWSSGMGYSPLRRASYPSRWLSLVCKMPMPWLGCQRLILLEDRKFCTLDNCGLTRCEAPEAAWAGCLTHGPGPPRQTDGALIMLRDYRTGEKAAGTSSLLACRIGRTPVWGGHAPPDWREASRTRVRSLRSLYTQMWTNLFSPPSSLVQQAARGENFSRASTALLHPSSTFGMSPVAYV